MSMSFGWCLDGKHHIPGDGTAVAAMNEGRCPGQSHDKALTCGCYCHKRGQTNGT